MRLTAYSYCLFVLIFISVFGPVSYAEENLNRKQFNTTSGKYVELTGIDPAKRFVQYPEGLRLLGDIEGKKILSIGCGNGIFERMLAKRGAYVVAYDPAEKMIEEAQRFEEKEKLGIRYYVADRPEAGSDGKFDKAVSVMVLMYAVDRENLREIFTYAHQSTGKKGNFYSITFNPNFRRFGQINYNRRITRTRDGGIQFEFLDESGKVKMTSKSSDFSTADFEVAAKTAGFKRVKWIRLQITPEGKEAKGKEFWKDFEDDCPYIGLVVSK
jgi:toxoflavin synthase